jgi:hypothetical protein
MRSAGNFSPEWGYLAPAPSFMRTARVVLVATTVGATAGAGVVLSLIDHPEAEGQKTAITMQPIVTAVQAATPPTIALAPVAATAAVTVPQAQIRAQIPMQAAVQTPPQAVPQIQVQSPAISSTRPAAPIAAAPSVAAPSVAALTDAPVTDTAPVDGTDQSVAAPDPLQQKKTKHTGQNGKKSGNGLGTVLRRLFTAHAGTSYYPNH